jgi:hypothetical protein
MRKQSAQGLTLVLSLSLVHNFVSSPLHRILILSILSLIVWIISVKTDKEGRPLAEEKEALRKEEEITKEVRRRVSSKNLSLAGLIFPPGDRKAS